MLDILVSFMFGHAMLECATSISTLISYGQWIGIHVIVLVKGCEGIPPLW